MKTKSNVYFLSGPIFLSTFTNPETAIGYKVFLPFDGPRATRDEISARELELKCFFDMNCCFVLCCNFKNNGTE